MEEIFMNPHSCYPSKVSYTPAMHKNSRVISKSKPKVRIIHIFAPEIIKIDAADFRELVQQLTGKPADQNSKTQIFQRNVHNTEAFNVHSSATSMEFQHGSPCNLVNEQVKVEEEEDTRSSDNKSDSFSNGFISYLTEFDDFQELFQFPVQPF